MKLGFDGWIFKKYSRKIDIKSLNLDYSVYNNVNFKLKAAEAIGNLYEKLEKNEPYSHGLFYDYAKVFARVVIFSSSKGNEKLLY